jgi:hypothetical protein
VSESASDLWASIVLPRQCVKSKFVSLFSQGASVPSSSKLMKGYTQYDGDSILSGVCESASP